MEMRTAQMRLAKMMRMMKVGQQQGQGQEQEQEQSAMVMLQK